MKTLILLLAMFVGSFMYAQNSSAPSGTITVSVPNVKSENGNILFALYTQDNFLQGKSQYSAVSEIENGQATGVFNEVPAGTYAVVILHDKNGNYQMDFDQNGMPMEAYGTSGNTMSYGPPTWEESHFSYDGKDIQMEIRL